MKKILMMVCSAAMVSLATLAQAQDQDTASANFNNKGVVEETQDSTENKTMDDAGIREGTISSEDQAQEGARPTQEQTDQTTQDQASDPVNQPTQDLGESTPVNDKMGPNGEPVHMENGKYFYKNEAGEKVSIEESALKDKTQ